MPLLTIDNLQTAFVTDHGNVPAIGGVDLTIERGETLALVGESGCGKSMTALSLLRLVPEPGRIVGGRIVFDGQELLSLPEEQMRALRGRRIAMIFQEPMTSLNPVFRIGEQIGEVLALHRGLTVRQAAAEAVELLRKVGIPAAESRVADYPHQLSGGMRQRVMIAMALAGEPDLLIADEPTTALDVTIQAQILELLRDLRAERGMATLLISHDLGVVAQTADRVAIMYAGLIVEESDVHSLFARPAHPYTRGLLACLPRLGEERTRLNPIPGQVPSLTALPAGCPFAPRCRLADAACRAALPALRDLSPRQRVRCIKANP